LQRRAAAAWQRDCGSVTGALRSSRIDSTSAHGVALITSSPLMAAQPSRSFATTTVRARGSDSAERLRAPSAAGPCAPRHYRVERR
jgi:hypothetical protein